MTDPRPSGREPQASGGSDDQPRSPLQLLEALAADEVRVTPTLRHVEVYTLHGLLTLLWHGDETADRVLLCSGGAMGGLLGPANALFHDLGERLWAEHGVATIRIGYRKPNHLPRCVHDVAAAADLATRSGARRFVTMGHSFGGAVAIQAGIVLEQHCAGVVTLSTQSAGCEMAASLRAPLLLFHGDRDEILPPETSYIVQSLAGHGEIVILEGNGHLLDRAAEQLRERLLTWIPDHLADTDFTATHT